MLILHIKWCYRRSKYSGEIHRYLRRRPHAVVYLGVESLRLLEAGDYIQGVALERGQISIPNMTAAEA
jgi:hypothetical protein